MGEKGRNLPVVQMDKLVLFLAYVINCSEQAKTKTEKIKIIVKAAVKFFNMRDLSCEKYIQILVMEKVHQTRKL